MAMAMREAGTNIGLIASVIIVTTPNTAKTITRSSGTTKNTTEVGRWNESARRGGRFVSGSVYWFQARSPFSSLMRVGRPI